MQPSGVLLYKYRSKWFRWRFKGPEIKDAETHRWISPRTLMKFSLNAKLAGAFALCVAIACALGLFSLWSASRLNGYTADIALRWLPAVNAAKGMQNGLLQMNLQIQRHIMANDEETRQLVEIKLYECATEFERHWGRFATLPGLRESQARLRRLDLLLKEYIGGMQIVLQISSQGNSSGAIERDRTSTARISDKMSIILSELAKSSEESSDLAAEQAGAAYHRLIVAAGVIIGILAASAAIVGWNITRGVARQLGGDPSYALDIVKRIAAGELSVEVKTRCGDDSSLLHAMRGMAAALSAMEAANAQLLSRLQLVMAAAPVGIAFTRERKFELVSAEFCRLFSRDPCELLGEPTHLTCTSIDEADALTLEAHAAFATGNAYIDERQMTASDGRLFWARLHARPIDPRRLVAGMIWTVTDISTEIVARHALEWSAAHDALTGMYNRREFDYRLARIVLSRLHSVPAALLIFDLDRFKGINDQDGHAAGDAVLKAVALAVAAATRLGDLAVRLGGDEFAVILERCHAEGAFSVATNISRAIEELRVPWKEGTLRVSASIGIAMLEDEMAHADAWVSAADLACYEAKHAGRNAVRVAASALRVEKPIG